jgi:hypothetical protein
MRRHQRHSIEFKRQVAQALPEGHSKVEEISDASLCT